MLVGFVGQIGAGKDTAADFLVNTHGFRRDSFASSLKDAVSMIFGWDRTLIEGRTKESREWRDQVDTWWSTRLKMPGLTPRFILQNWGTEVCRAGFHDDIWIASLENKLRKTNDHVVISDVRFPNEIAAIHNAGGIVIRIKRGHDPEWLAAAESFNRGPVNNMTWSLSKEHLRKLGIHASEYSWVGGNIDFTVTNDGTVDDLFVQLEQIIRNLESSHLDAKAA